MQAGTMPMVYGGWQGEHMARPRTRTPRTLYRASSCSSICLSICSNVKVLKSACPQVCEQMVCWV